MKIVSYVHAYVPFHNGGAETTLHELNRALVKAGHDCTVVIRERPYKHPDDYEIEGVKVVFARDKKTILHYLPSADLALTHLECSTRATLLGNKFKTPVAHLVHNDLDLTRSYIAGGADCVIYNSDWIRAKFKDDFGKLPSITVHPVILADRYKVNRGSKITLVNLFESKGQDVFWPLAERMSDLQFLAVIGGYGEQKIRHDLPNVEIMENDFDVRNVYAKTKIILMPSRYESYGRVACEAAACGIPSIVADTPGLREALGDAGTYVPRSERVTDSELDAWENALRASLKPRKYGTLSRLALARSEALDSLSKAEIDSFVLFVEQFVSLYKKKR